MNLLDVKVVAAGLAAAALLAACGMKTESAPTVMVAPVEVKVQNSIGLENLAIVSEVCIKGVVYLMTDRGGITPKINPEMASSGYISMNYAPFVRCR